MGAASFIELQDSEGRIQVYVKRDEICPGEDKTMYNTVFKKLLDIGDFVGIKGYAFITQTGALHSRQEPDCALQVAQGAAYSEGEGG